MTDKDELLEPVQRARIVTVLTAYRTDVRQVLVPARKSVDMYYHIIYYHEGLTYFDSINRDGQYRDNFENQERALTRRELDQMLIDWFQDLFDSMVKFSLELKELSEDE